MSADNFTWNYVKGKYVITKNKEISIAVPEDSIQELINCLKDIQDREGLYQNKVKAREL